MHQLQKRHKTEKENSLFTNKSFKRVKLKIQCRITVKKRNKRRAAIFHHHVTRQFLGFFLISPSWPLAPSPATTSEDHFKSTGFPPERLSGSGTGPGKYRSSIIYLNIPNCLHKTATTPFLRDPTVVVKTYWKRGALCWPEAGLRCWVGLFLIVITSRKRSLADTFLPWHYTHVEASVLLTVWHANLFQAVKLVSFPTIKPIFTWASTLWLQFKNQHWRNKTEFPTGFVWQYTAGNPDQIRKQSL